MSWDTASETWDTIATTWDTIHRLKNVTLGGLLSQLQGKAATVGVVAIKAMPPKSVVAGAALDIHTTKVASAQSVLSIADIKVFNASVSPIKAMLPKAFAASASAVKRFESSSSHDMVVEKLQLSATTLNGSTILRLVKSLEMAGSTIKQSLKSIGLDIYTEYVVACWQKPVEVASSAWPEESLSNNIWSEESAKEDSWTVEGVPTNGC